MAVFDRHVVVDWSASSTPKVGRDSVWMAVADDRGTTLSNPSTRAEAMRELASLCEADPWSTTLVGVDFSLGYPTGTAAALRLDGVAWSAMWGMLAGELSDSETNENNRFVVAADLNRRLSGSATPFWGCPPSCSSRYLGTTKPADEGPVGTWRTVEQVLRDQRYRPFSSWQLLGAGAVGSQSLLGIACLHRLRQRLDGRVEVWPFTTGLNAPTTTPGAVVVAEVWPSMLTVDVADGVIRDAAQVAATVGWLVDLDNSGRLGDLFSPDVPAHARAAVVAEEGWVLGVTR